MWAQSCHLLAAIFSYTGTSTWSPCNSFGSRRDHLHYHEVLRHQLRATMHVKNRPGGVAQKLEAQSVVDIVAEDICLPRVVVEDVLPVVGKGSLNIISFRYRSHSLLNLSLKNKNSIYMYVYVYISIM